MATYVLSDIHGLYDKFTKMLELINFNSEDTLYILGDVIDRGPDSIKTLDLIRKNDNMFLLLGNHEQMLLDFFTCDNELIDLSNHPWLKRGGASTYNELIEKDPEYLYDLLIYLSELPRYTVIDNYVLVHAGLSTNPNVSTLEEAIHISTDDDFLWSRDFIYKDKKIDNYTVICGHTQTANFGSDHIIRFKNNILIDCGCASNKTLGCLRLEDMNEFYI